MEAARGRKTVGESWWMLWRWSYVAGADGAVGEEEEGVKWAARVERRLRAVDMVVVVLFLVTGFVLVAGFGEGRGWRDVLYCEAFGMGSEWEVR
jgi:hypothetical protein